MKPELFLILLILIGVAIFMQWRSMQREARNASSAEALTQKPEAEPSIVQGG